MTAISYHDTVNDLQGLSFAGDGPFARREWFGLLEQSGAKPIWALARDGDQAIALPLAANGHGLVGLSNWYAFTWSELATHDARPGLRTALAKALAVRTDRVVLDRLPTEQAQVLEEAFRGAGWLTLAEPSDRNHVLAPAGRSFAEYLAARPGPLRTTLKRKAGKVEVEILDRFDPDAWAAYQSVYRESWKPAEGDRALLQAFAEAEAAAGHLRLGLARHESAVVAAQFWTVENGTAYIHKLAHRESAKALSPGTTLTAALLEHVIDRDGVSLVDFGTGDDPYKRDWMEQIRPRHRLTCWRPGAPRNWPGMGRALLRRLVSSSARR